MKIRVKDISASGSYFEGVLSPAQLDVDRDYWHLTGPARVEVSAYRVGDYVSMSIKVMAEATKTCTRCLKDVVSDQVWEFSQQVRIADELEELDVPEMVREEIILNIGVKELCKEDCLGLCPRCGGDRNAGECTCDVEVI